MSDYIKEKVEELNHKLWQYDNRIDADEHAWELYWKEEWEQWLTSSLQEMEERTKLKMTDEIINIIAYRSHEDTFDDIENKLTDLLSHKKDTGEKEPKKEKRGR